MKNKDIISWWESKRILYNVILLLFCVYLVYHDFKYYSKFEPEVNYSVTEKIGFIVFWIFGANIFYCLGTGFETTLKKYGFIFSKYIRITLFVFGVVASILWTTFSLSPI